MPDNSASIGTPLHEVVLPVLAARLAKPGIGIPSLVETPTLPGGSKKGQKEGFIDLTVLVPPASPVVTSAIEAHVYDLKPGGSLSGAEHAKQVRRYVQYFNRGTVPGISVVSPRIGTALYGIAARHPDILAPIDIPGTMGRAYIGLQLTAPGIIEYHLGARIPPVRVPVPELKPKSVHDVRKERAPDPKPVPWYVPVGAAIGTAAVFIAWKAKGCVFGPVGCAVGAAF
jgi:hypothetical protein